MPDVDDGSILDDAALLRRIRPDQIVDDENAGRRRPSSAAFRQLEMSVDTEPLLVANGLDWRFTLTGYQDYSLARFPARLARAHGLPVIHKPIPAAPPLPANPAHTEVHGKKTDAKARALGEGSEWAHLEPEQPAGA